jgi:hypothetical protein
MIVAATVVAVLFGGIEGAAAKTYRTHSGSSHASGSTRVHTPRAAKPKANYVIVKCKTKACFKKHPSGTYGFVPKAKKTQ